LDDVELRLDESEFVRVHRNHIVNISHIAAVRREGSEILLELAVPTPTVIPVSRGRLSWLKTRRAVRFMRQLRAAQVRSG
jgi:DNA-binding LytR/AlgR family response regulator